MRQYCPQCDKTYDGVDFDTCPEDGARLFLRSDTRDDPLVGTVLDERFRIERPLSEGGMGAVYRATQLSVNREVALKVLRPNLEQDDHFLERFFREARVIADLSHPNVVRLIDFGQDRSRDVLYLVMELVRGTEMGDILSQGRLDPALALEVAYQVCAGLTEPHSRGIVHRDLKPANIILLPSSDETFLVKILDFGIASTADSGTQLTQTGMICGTPSYMSPEQAQNIEVDERTDLYSLGVVLFEMLTGHLPFRGPSGLQLLIDHVQRPAPQLAAAYPDSIPKEVADLVSALMEKDPANRPQSAKLVRRRVQKIRRQLSLPPVYLQQSNDAKRDIETAFSPWVLADLDPERLDEVPTQPPSSNEGFLDTLDNAESSPPMTPLGTAADTEERSGRAETAPVGPESSVTAPARSGGTDRFLVASLVVVSLLLAGGIVALVAAFVSADDTDDVEAPSIEPSIAQEADDELEALAQADDPVDFGEERVDSAEEAFVDSPASDPDHDEGLENDPEDQTEQPSGSDSRPSDSDTDSPPDDPATEVAKNVPPQPGAGRAPPMPADPSDAEPVSTTGEVHEGSLILERRSQVQDAQKYGEITGDLTIRLNFDDISDLELSQLAQIRGNLYIDALSTLSTVALPKLQNVGGGLMITQNDTLRRLEAPKLRSVRRNLMLNSNAMESFELNGLRQVGELVIVSDNEQLSTLSLGELERIGGGFSVMQNPALQTLVLPKLQEIEEDFNLLTSQVRTLKMEELTSIGGGLTINQNEHLRVLKMGNLSRVAMSSTHGAGLTLNEASQLEELDLSGLREVNNNLLIGSLSRINHLDLGRLTTVGAQLTLTDNQAVETIDLQSLKDVGGNLLINGHEALRDLTLRDLDLVEDLLVMNSPHLSTCEIEALAQSMKDDGWSGDARLVNVDDAPCP